MKKLILLGVAISFLGGCSVETNVLEQPKVNVEKVRENAMKLMNKEMDLPIAYKKSTYTLWGVSIGDDVEKAKKVFGDAKKVTMVDGYWRYDTVMSFEKDNLQVDIAVFRNQIDEITVTIPKKRKVNWDGFKKTFNGKVYTAKQEVLDKEKNEAMTYYVNNAEDEWLIVQTKKNGTLLLTDTYTYDLPELKEKQQLNEVKERRE